MEGGSLVALLVAIVSGTATIAVAVLSLRANAKSTAASAEVQQGANVLEGYDELTKNQASRITAQDLRIRELEAKDIQHQETEHNLRENINRVYDKLGEVRKECGTCKRQLDQAMEVIEDLRHKVEDNPKGV